MVLSLLVAILLGLTSSPAPKEPALSAPKRVSVLRSLFITITPAPLLSSRSFRDTKVSEATLLVKRKKAYTSHFKNVLAYDSCKLNRDKPRSRHNRSRK